jgi:hypothetical protein
MLTFTSPDQIPLPMKAALIDSMARSVYFPGGTLPRFSWNGDRSTDAATLVPIVPPQLRPKHDLANYHTFWEVEHWTLCPPRDPMLLRHLGGWLYAVLAVWDLTPVERAVLGAPART